ncbi:hypothetical protein D3C72_2477240 [compost metagenome]
MVRNNDRNVECPTDGEGFLQRFHDLVGFVTHMGYVDGTARAQRLADPDDLFGRRIRCSCIEGAR